jgi:hypothetical protein
LKQQIKDSHTEEIQDQKEGAVDGVLPRDHQQGSEEGGEGHPQKDQPLKDRPDIFSHSYPLLQSFKVRTRVTDTVTLILHLYGLNFF